MEVDLLVAEVNGDPLSDLAHREPQRAIELEHLLDLLDRYRDVVERAYASGLLRDRFPSLRGSL